MVTNARRRTIKTIQLGKDAEGWDEVIAIQAFYQKGGINYFNYKQEQSGYYVLVRHETRQDGVTKYGMFSGVKTMVLQADRFNAKKLGQVSIEDNKVREMVAQIISDDAGHSPQATPNLLAWLQGDVVTSLAKVETEDQQLDGYLAENQT